MILIQGVGETGEAIDFDFAVIGLHDLTFRRGMKGGSAVQRSGRSRPLWPLERNVKTALLVLSCCHWEQSPRSLSPPPPEE